MLWKTRKHGAELREGRVLGVVDDGDDSSRWYSEDRDRVCLGGGRGGMRAQEQMNYDLHDMHLGGSCEEKAAATHLYPAKPAASKPDCQIVFAFSALRCSDGRCSDGKWRKMGCQRCQRAWDWLSSPSRASRATRGSSSNRPLKVATATERSTLNLGR